MSCEKELYGLDLVQIGFEFSYIYMRLFVRNPVLSTGISLEGNLAK